jgi:hypothetical protein
MALLIHVFDILDEIDQFHADAMAVMGRVELAEPRSSLPIYLGDRFTRRCHGRTVPFARYKQAVSKKAIVGRTEAHGVESGSEETKSAAVTIFWSVRTG